MPLVEVTFYGRGGQGAVTGAIILAEAAAYEGNWSQAVPIFGAERRGAPVKAYARIDDKYIRVRGEIKHPDAVVVLDPTLLETVNVAEGLKEGGIVIVNIKADPRDIAKKLDAPKAATVDASAIALEVIGKNITNTAMLGALLKCTNLVKLETILKIVRERFTGDLGKRNVEAIEKAYKQTKVM